MRNNQDDIEIGTLLKIIATQLNTVGIEDPARESEIIISEELNLPRAALAVEQDKIIPGEKVELIEHIVERRMKHEPLQYIFGKAYFMNMWFHVGPGILIPRPETELLVEKVCREAPQDGEICDLGTGCGTIALAIAFERPDLKVTGSDVSLRAMNAAKENRDEW
ncbi:MAG: N5-glutamine methyltransferase family protein, partial [Victivallaceae bacterium]